MSKSVSYPKWATDLALSFPAAKQNKKEATSNSVSIRTDLYLLFTVSAALRRIETRLSLGGMWGATPGAGAGGVLGCGGGGAGGARGVHVETLSDAAALLGRLPGAVGQHQLLAILCTGTDSGSGMPAVPLDARGQEW